MATHDYVLDNATGANFRSDLNNALAAIVSNNSSSSEPSTKYAYQWWADTNTGILKIRNSANDGWVSLLQLDGTLTLEDGSASAPALGFRDDLNTGIFSSAADTLDVTCGGTTRGSFSSSGLTVTGNVTATTFVGDVDANNGDFDGTLEADAITVAGVALNTVIASVASGSVVVTDESSDTTCFPLFVTAATGNLATKTGSNLSFNSSNGTLTATAFAGDGSALTGVGGTTINNNANNRVITGSASANTLEAESGFIVKASGEVSVGPTTVDADRGAMSIKAAADASSVPINLYLQEQSGDEGYGIGVDGDGDLNIYNGGATTPNLEIKDDNNVAVTQGNLIIGTSGKGIDFSATGGPTNGTGSSELLDDYEEGSWTPAPATGTAGAVGNCRYVKIGRVVHVQGGLSNFSDQSSSTGIEITGFPFVLTFLENAKFACTLSRVTQRATGYGGVVDMLHNTSTAFPSVQSNSASTGLSIRHQDLNHNAASIIFSGTYTTN